MPWLFARLTASTPAWRRTVTACGGARKVNSFGWGVPRAVMAVSRFSTARSAELSTPKALPRRPDSAAADEPSKCTSPANASTADPPPERVERGAGEADDAADDEEAAPRLAALPLPLDDAM